MAYYRFGENILSMSSWAFFPPYKLWVSGFNNEMVQCGLCEIPSTPNNMRVNEIIAPSCKCVVSV